MNSPDLEVSVRAPASVGSQLLYLALAEQRDVKGLYAKARRGELSLADAQQ